VGGWCKLGKCGPPKKIESCRKRFVPEDPTQNATWNNGWNELIKENSERGGLCGSRKKQPIGENRKERGNIGRSGCGVEYMLHVVIRMGCYPQKNGPVGETKWRVKLRDRKQRRRHHNKS